MGCHYRIPPSRVRDLYRRGSRKIVRARDGRRYFPDTTGLVYTVLTETMTADTRPAQVRARQNLSTKEMRLKRDSPDEEAICK